MTHDSKMSNAIDGQQPTWREAATLVIVSKDETSLTDSSRPLTDRSRPLTVSCDYRILFLQRETRSRSFAGASVFPGGIIEAADFSPKWFDLFGSLGIHRDDDFGWGHMKGKPRAGPIAAPRERGLLPNDVAFRICAIRETFEESGILLASREADVMRSISLRKEKRFVPSASYSDSVMLHLQEWRRRVHEDAYQFLEMCLQLEVYPNLWSLFELSTILTPPVTSRRFDTIFYISTLDKQPYAEVDHKEMVDLKWLKPAEGIRMHCCKDIELPMPQLSECARFLDFPQLTDLQEYVTGQMDQAMSVEVPVVIKLKDVMVRVLPGDDYYPTIRSSEDAKLLTFNENEEENLKRCQNLNRFTFIPNGHFKMICNVTLPYGQHPPRDIDSNDWLSDSRL